MKKNTTWLLTALLTILLVGGITVSKAYAATQTVPDKVDVTIHKGMTLTGQTQASIKADGETHDWTNDTTDYDATKYGTVGFTAYDITKNVGDLSDLTDAKIKEIIADVKDKGTGSSYLDGVTGSEQDITSGSTTTFKDLAASDSTSKHHVWVFLETKASQGLTNQKADPIVTILPMTNAAGDGFQTTSNFYPKNTMQKLSFTLTKKGEDNDGTTTDLAGAKFNVYTGKPGSGTIVKDSNGNPVTLTSDDKGQVVVNDLVVGSYYLVEIPSNVADSGKTNSTPKYVLGANAKNDSNNKLAFTVTSDGVDTSTLNAEYINFAKPDAVKTVDSATSNFEQGSLVPFKATVDVPQDIAATTVGKDGNGKDLTSKGYGVFTWTDTPDKGLTWSASEGNLTLATEDGTKLVEGTDFTVTNTDNGGFKIDWIINGKVSNLVAKQAGKKLVIKYNMVLSDSLAVVDTAINNNWDLSFQNHPATDSDKDVSHITGKVPVTTYGAKFVKESSGLFNSGVAGTKLAGAKYVIKNSEGKYFNGFADGTDADDVPEAKWVDKLSDVDAGIFTSDDKGAFEIAGLAAGKYSAHEVKAPAGYSLATEDVDFEVGQDTYSDSNKIVKLVDDRKSVLPDTGSNEGKALMLGLIVLVIATAGTGFYEYKKHQMKA